MKFVTTQQLDVSLLKDPAYIECIKGYQFQYIAANLLPALAAKDACFMAKMDLDQHLNGQNLPVLERSVHYEQLTQSEYVYLQRALQFFRANQDATKFIIGGNYNP